jgi:hypothetical protein
MESFGDETITYAATRDIFVPLSRFIEKKINVPITPVIFEREEDFMQFGAPSSVTKAF